MEINTSIKETENLLEYNVWSCGDYLHNLNGFSVNSNFRVSVSNEFSITGDYSVKLTPTIDPTNGYGIVRMPLTLNTNKHYLFQGYCKNNVSGASLRLVESDNISKLIVLPVSNNFDYFSLEFTPTTQNILLIFWTYNSENNMYVDNLNLRGS